MTASRDENDARGLPVTVVTGFLGSGKTTLVNRLLTDAHGLRLAVVVNEFGDLAIDGVLVDGRAGQVTELANGCLCCVRQHDLAAALDTIARAGSFDGVVVETSGLAAPLGVAEVLASSGSARDLTLDGVVTLVDCANFDTNLTYAAAAYEQLVGADLLVLNKRDLVGDETIDRLRIRLRTLNRRAAMFATSHADVPVDLLLGAARDTGTVEPIPTPRSTHSGSPRAVSLTLDQPVDRHRFMSWTGALAGRIVRIKALVRFTDDACPYVFHGVGARFDVTRAPRPAWRRLGGAGAHVVVFGSDLDSGALDRGLRACAVPGTVAETSGTSSSIRTE